MFEYALILVTFVLFAISAINVGFLPFPTILILFLGVSQIMSILALNDIVPYDMHFLFNYGGLQINLALVHIIYTSVALLSLISLSGRFKTLQSVDLTGTLRELLNNRSHSRYIWTLTAIVLCCTHLVLTLLISDWSQVWFHERYLVAGKDARWVAILGESLSDTILKAGPAFAILSCLCICALIGTRHTILKFLASALTFIYFSSLLGEHSRAAAFFPLLLAINFALMGLKSRAIVIPILLFVAGISFLSALAGRGIDRHGLSALPETILLPFASSDPIYDILQAVMDSCQGIVVTAESFLVPGDFNLAYKILAFSPLPSFIDGYSSIREVSEHRLHDYVPMSGVGEVYHFGWLFIALLFIGYIAVVRAHTKLAVKNPALFILCNLLITLSIYVLFAYPLRNALRFFWLAAALVIAGNYMKKKSTKALPGRVGPHRTTPPPTGAFN